MIDWLINLFLDFLLRARCRYCHRVRWIWERCDCRTRINL